MRRLFFILVAAMMAAGMMAQDKLSFVIAGSEEDYNQIRIVNETSEPYFHCRVVVLDKDDKIVSEYGEYYLNGIGDIVMHTHRISRGTKIGIQLPADSDMDLDFSVEYRDLPIFDAIVIHLRDKSIKYSDTF